MPAKPSRQQHSNQRLLRTLLTSFAAVLLWSGIEPFDRFVWSLEVLPALGALCILAATYRRFPLTHLSYSCVWLHAIVLCIGAHYTYAEVPLFHWLREVLDLTRNHYDRVGHFSQGFFPAIIAREVLLRTSPLRPGKWLFAIALSICLAASAFYELFEWWVALATGEAADAFLCTQGDVWDTQWDMAMCMSGAISALIVLRRVHDRQFTNSGMLPA